MRQWMAAGLLLCALPASAMELGRGVSLDLAYIGEGVRNLQPGLVDPRKRTTYHDLFDASLTVDRDRWALFVRGMRMHGVDPSATRIGDLQTASNIEAPDQALLYEAWLELRFGRKTQTAFLVGLHDLNSEFDVSEYASLLINSSFGIGPEISVNVPSSIYPRPAAAVRLRIANDEGGYLALAAYDGDPATRAVRPKAEGLMYIGEIGLHWNDLGHPGVLKLGAWLHTANKPSPFVAGKVFSHVAGRYFVLEQELASWDEGDFGFFVQYGATQRDRNEVPSYFGAGLHLHGVWFGIEQEIGLGFNRAEIQQTLQQRTDERVIELDWRFALFDGRISVQPCWQRIIRPSGVAGKQIDLLLLRATIEI